MLTVNISISSFKFSKGSFSILLNSTIGIGSDSAIFLVAYKLLYIINFC